VTQIRRKPRTLEHVIRNCILFNKIIVSLAISVTASSIVEAEGNQSPGPRFGHEMVYDEARDVTVLFGGFGPNGIPKGDTWLWDGKKWQLAATDGPAPRKWPAAAYDSHRAVVVLHGGREGEGRSGASLDDTWIWDGQSWRQAQVEGPSPRDHHRAVYDRARDRVVLFGGWNGNSLEKDTWEWDGARWKQVAQTGPTPRAPFGFSYHESLETVVLAGGQDLTGASDDIWTWDGSTWEQLSTVVPGSRGFHAMTYASNSSHTLLFGGRDGDELLNDLWAWNGRDWSRLSSSGPVRRGIYASAYDRRRGELVIHGSGDRVDGKWMLDGETWAWSADEGWRVVSGGE
jgi:hypothetical protein